MTEIVFRQKTPEEMQADAAAKQKRELTAPDREEPMEKLPAVAVDGSGFALEAESAEPKPKKGHKK